MNFVIVRTGGGSFYGGRIGQELIANGHRAICAPFWEFMTLIKEHGWTKENTVIHTRAAYPSRTGWMGDLFRLERDGWAVINSPKATYLTSDKLGCAEKLIEAGLPHPTTRRFNNSTITADDMQQVRRVIDDLGGSAVVKPLTSNGNGKHIALVRGGDTDGQLREKINAIPTPNMIQQEVPYVGLYRVCVFDGGALGTVWRDRPANGRWKVSVCLNPNMSVEANPPQQLRELAVKAQEVVGGDINFIDIFEIPDGRFVMSEINTACNLRHHERLSGINLAKKIAETLVRLTGG